jgi:hypothetical protein
MSLDPVTCEVFDLSRDSSADDLIESVMRKAGRWDQFYSLGSDGRGLYAAIAREITELFLDGERRVHVIGKAKDITLRVCRDFLQRENAPGVLLALNPRTYLPAGTIEQLHSAARVKAAEECVPVVARILRNLAEDEKLVDISVQ